MKILKLLLLAIVFVGAVIGLLYINSDPGTDNLDEPEFVSEKANEWKQRINELCKDGHWSATGYQAIEEGIHTDRVTGNGSLISNADERALNRYLLALSCSSVWESADKHFKQSSYDESKIKDYEEANSFLRDKVGRNESNSNLTELSALLSEYDRIHGLLNFNRRPRFPLKSYSAPSASESRSSVCALKHYDSHFSKNEKINEMMSGLSSKRDAAEKRYYDDMADLIIRTFKNSRDEIKLLEDQMEFNAISTNEEATARLTNFINDPDK